MTEKKAEWVSLTEASRRFGVSIGKLSTMANKGEIRKAADPKDNRKVLVDAKELEEKFRLQQ